MDIYDLMIDLETLGISTGCGIQQIGSCLFSRYDDFIDNPKVIFVDKDSNAKYKLRSDASTMRWWSNQSKEALALFNRPGKDLKEALEEFSGSYNWREIDCVWSHGATFDIPILERAFKVCRLRVPWHFQKVRDTRTLFDLFPTDKKNNKNELKHSAKHDSYYQALKVKESLRKYQNVQDVNTIPNYYK